MLRPLIAATVALCVLFGASHAQDGAPLHKGVIAQFDAPPSVPEGPLAPSLAEAMEDVLAIALAQAQWSPDNTSSLDALARVADPRLVWTLTDMLRFAWRPEFRSALARAAETILGRSFEGFRQRAEIINSMIAWDVPAYPGYLAHKRQVFTNYIPGMEALFAEGDMAWQMVDWGGVRIDARPYNGTDEQCHCIPAVDNPEVSSAAQATWLSDDDIVFGVVVNGEARAYPRRIMEVREMVNDTLGGRDLGIPYCTLCGAAQAFYTDGLPEGVKRPILRSSGLLIRSNKVMYDIETHSVFDTFLGRAVTGPLGKIGLQFEQATVITAEWGAWRAAYPNTTVLVEALALGRDFNLRATRDAHGPIFPVGDVDPRLPAHEDVIGVLTAEDGPVAFPRATAMAALTAGQEVAFGDLRLRLSAGGVRATDAKGADVASHQAFWFAWSQFHPTTTLWGE